VSTLAVFLSHEWRFQRRSKRFWLTALIYLVLCAFSQTALYLREGDSWQLIGAATYAARLFGVQPLFTAFFIAVNTLGGINRERDEGSLAILFPGSITNSGYLVRRWLSLLAVLTPVTLLPPAMAYGMAHFAGHPPVAMGPFVWPWLLQVLPTVLILSMLALGAATIAGGTVVALLTGMFLIFGSAHFVNDLLAPHGKRVTSPLSWINGRGLQETMSELGPYSRSTPATEAPPDLRAAASRHLVPVRVDAGMALSILALSVAYLRRGRRDLRPWRIDEAHRLRSFLRLANTLRQRAVPDPGLAPIDRAVIVVGLVGFVLTAWSQGARQSDFRRVADLRYAAEMSPVPPTPAELVPVDWSITGTLELDGQARLEVALVVENRGTVPIGRAACMLDPKLSIDRLAGDRASVRHEQRWDRVELSFDPPIAAGERLTLNWSLSGNPGETRLNLPGAGSFASRYESLQRARHAHEIPDLALAYESRAITDRRIDLRAWQLSPVLRYTGWELTGEARSRGEVGRVVPSERSRREVDLALELDAPRQVTLADPCGTVSSVETGRSRLRSGCSIRMAELRIVGGSFESIEGAAGIGALLVLPAHRAQGERHLPSLARAAKTAREAWPQLDPLSRAVVIEWPPEFDSDPTAGMFVGWNFFSSSSVEIESVGRLLLIPESSFVLRQPLNPTGLAIETAAARMFAQRRLHEAQHLFFDAFFRWLAQTRLDPSGGGGVVSGPSRGRSKGELQQSLLDAGPWDSTIWRQKLPAVFFDVRRRIGAHQFAAAVEDFLATEDEQAGTARELFETLVSHSGVALERTYEDLVEGNALPELTLENVTFRSRGRGWSVAGAVVNRGSGEAFCPVELRTEAGSVFVDVHVTDAGKAPFRIDTRERPRSLLLDPRRVCYRFEPHPKGKLIDRVEYEGDS